jgi:predicted phage tail protein
LDRAFGERPENKPSFLFDGPVNTITQGHPVPVGYGKAFVGSR